MRIGLCGAGSTGKTTVAKAVAERLGVPFLPSVARSVMIEEWGLSSEADMASLAPIEQDQCQHMLFVRRLNVELMAEAFVSDRTMVDHAAYRLMYGAARIGGAEVEHMFAAVSRAMARLTKTFFFGTDGFPMVGDAFRNGNGSMRHAVDVLMRGLLDRCGVPYVVVPVMDEAARTAFVVERL